MGSIKFSAVGDILLSGTVSEMIKNGNFEKLFQSVIAELRKRDLIFGNLECPLSNRGNPLKNKCCLYSPSFTVKSLKLAGFNIVSLANNHIFDHDYEGFQDTVACLEENNISYFGAGKNLEDARKPAVLYVNNISIGFLGYSWNFIGSINATKNKFGTAPLNKKIILEDIKKLEGKTDKVIVSLHWGYDRERYPLPSQRKLAHKIIDAGADLILGHHPHVLQGIEKYRGKIIIYSLGNFIFPDIFYKNYNLIQTLENKESIIFNCKISKKEIKDFEIIPIKSNNKFQLDILKNNEKQLLLEKIENLSLGFKIENYSQFWKKNRVRKDLPDVKDFKFCNNLIYRFYKSKLGFLILKFI